MKRLVIAVAAFAAMGGALVRADEYVPKSKSFAEAMNVLRDPPFAFERVKQMEDVDALRVVAFAACAAAWPMEAGPDREFDDMMH